MSHYTVIVALPPGTGREQVQEALAARLAPFDENKEVEPYREYIENWSEQYGRALKWFGDGEHPEDKPAGLDELDVAAVLSAYNDAEVHEESPEDSSVVLYYRLSTYNPLSKWDWYSIGGRWTGYFPVKTGHGGDSRLILGQGGAFGNMAEPGRVDGGPRGLLDFEALRTDNALEAGQRYDRWTALVDKHPKAEAWSSFIARHEADPEGYPIGRARQEYHPQPLIQAARKSNDFPIMSCPIDYFSAGREDYVQQAADQAVPAYAYLDPDGTWHAPGEMGWFGVSSDGEQERAAHYARMNALLDALDPETVLVLVDCHI